METKLSNGKIVSRRGFKVKVLVAVDSFKGSLSFQQAGNAVEAGLLEVFPSWPAHTLPVADGGEGTACVAQFLGGEIIFSQWQDIYERRYSAHWVLWNDTAVVDAAVSSGFVDAQERIRGGEATTSYGTGQLIEQALHHPRVKRIVVALGGTGCTDGGTRLWVLGFPPLPVDSGRPITRRCEHCEDPNLLYCFDGTY
ncbi:MAG: hypothetical protein C7B43_01660 [Sulfobacillus benefaciens]|uniref:Glycerate kinase n=1 Tax=Sulfobacillus benefaciens TaxID=453960 RepID=A0A2T2XAB7_9FIRM|nr:MAG: hypothetical protein C7B43_01660 [Sulfobacillus benefaciens]